jgi:hypothetical protein
VSGTHFFVAGSILKSNVIVSIYVGFAVVERSRTVAVPFLHSSGSSMHLSPFGSVGSFFSPELICQ